MAGELIEIRYTKTDGVMTLQDALYLTQEEIDALRETGIEAMMEERFNSWLAAVYDDPNSSAGV